MFALAVISAVLGVLAILGGVPLAVNAAVAIAAVVSGHIAQIGCKKLCNQRGAKLALAGIVLGYVGIVTSVVIPAFVG
jgi:hypothetical protein